MIPRLCITLEAYLKLLNESNVFDDFGLKQLLRYASDKGESALMNHAADLLSRLTLDDSRGEERLSEERLTRQFWASLYRALAGFPINLGEVIAYIKFSTEEELEAAYMADSPRGFVYDTANGPEVALPEATFEDWSEVNLPDQTSVPTVD